MNIPTRLPARRHPRRRRPALAVALLATMTVTLASGATAHGPDPILGGGMFAQNQDLRFRWRAGSEPTTVLKTAIRAAAAAATATRGSKAATLTYDANGPDPIGYGAGAPCGVNGLACFTRDAPTGFTMWLREQGHVFDWGTMKWCQAYATAPNGCYDAETIALDEFGHVEGLDHHVNDANDADYVDAVVQTYSRTKPSAGWNAHAFGPCDIATLQMQYDVQAWTARYSTCLDLSTALTLVGSSSVVTPGATVNLSATLTVVDLAAYVRLGGDPVSGRTVTLQRRAPGATAWTSIGSMANGSASGTYVLAQRPAADAEFRAVFKSPTDEGLEGDTSGTVRVFVSTCTSALDGLAAIDAICP